MHWSLFISEGTSRRTPTRRVQGKQSLLVDPNMRNKYFMNQYVCPFKYKQNELSWI